MFIFVLVASGFDVINQTIVAKTGVKRLSSRQVYGFRPTFKSFNAFSVDFTCAVRSESSFIPLPGETQSPPHHLLKKPCLPHCVSVFTSGSNRVDHSSFVIQLVSGSMMLGIGLTRGGLMWFHVNFRIAFFLF